MPLLDRRDGFDRRSTDRRQMSQCSLIANAHRLMPYLMVITLLMCFSSGVLGWQMIHEIEQYRHETAETKAILIQIANGISINDPRLLEYLDTGRYSTSPHPILKTDHP